MIPLSVFRNETQDLKRADVARPKQQHYVTRAYLEGFLAKGERFLVCYGRGKGPFKRQPEDVASQRNYYAVKNADGSWDDSLENLIERFVEAPGLPVLKKLATRKTDLTWEERENLARLIAFQEMRTPAARARVLETTQALTDRLVREVTTADPDQRSIELVGEDGKKSTVTLDEIITSQQELHGEYCRQTHRLTIGPALKITPILARMKFTVHYSLDREFVTTDTPVIRVFRTRAALGYGLQRRDIEVRFPLARWAFLTLTHDHQFLKLFEGATRARQRTMLEQVPKVHVRYVSGSDVDAFNRGHTRHARMWLFAPSAVGWAKELLAEASAAPAVRDLSRGDLMHFQSTVTCDPSIDAASN